MADDKLVELPKGISQPLMTQLVNHAVYWHIHSFFISHIWTKLMFTLDGNSAYSTAIQVNVDVPYHIKTLKQITFQLFLM